MKPTYSDAGKLAWYPDIACPVCGGDVNSWDKRCSRALGYAAVLRLHPKDRIFAGRIEKQYLVQCCNNAHSTSPPFLFTLPARQLFSHGIFAIQTP